MPSSKTPGTKLLAQNRKARYDYHIEETFEAGIELRGTETKPCREGRVNFTDAYVSIKDGEAWLLQCHISPYSHGNRTNHDPTRPRKLLLHRAELDRLAAKIAEEGRTLVPLRMYLKHGRIKVEIAIARGKRSYDKRETQARRDAERQMRRELGRRR